ncbi:hypothetical protein ACFSJY_04485 [Thalassotalea euphylliae]|uniref:hypothetical protein n=1 Tax=Thalassotalea euphylliae TaxID=1655234 RepID=UPI00362DBF91
MKKKTHQSLITTQVVGIIDRMFKPSPIKDATIDGALEYFAAQSDIEKANNDFAQRAHQYAEESDKDDGSKASKIERKVATLDNERAEFEQLQKFDRSERSERLNLLCYDILELTEGETFAETNRKSAQVLGTIQLLSHTEGSQIAQTNELHKALYKGVLTLRLLDKLIIDGGTNHAYIKHFLGEYTLDNYKDFKRMDEAAYATFVHEVKVPVLKAAILQDIGNYHPNAQDILYGKDKSLDPYRTLEIDERKSLLQINYRETVKYLVEGIGQGRYLGNSKKDREVFEKQEVRKLKFMKELLRSAITPKEGLGNLLKVPQIYVSIVLSTKPSYKYKLIPKVYQVLRQNAERGQCSEKVVESLYQITGMFPQGYGVTYLAVDAAGHSLERYEYAIVNHLYPENPEEPECRIATRQLTFISYGSDIRIHKSENLYFPESAKRLASISRARLEEILEKLVSNYQERIELDLIPRCWHPREFFSIKENQKLWNKSSK